MRRFRRRAVHRDPVTRLLLGACLAALAITPRALFAQFVRGVVLPEAAIDAVPPHLISFAIVLRPHEAGVLFGDDAQNGVLYLVTKMRSGGARRRGWRMGSSHSPTTRSRASGEHAVCARK